MTPKVHPSLLALKLLSLVHGSGYIYAGVPMILFMLTEPSIRVSLPSCSKFSSVMPPSQSFANQPRADPSRSPSYY